LSVDDVATTEGDRKKNHYHFDRHSAEYRSKFKTITEEMHAKCPMAWTETYGGHWVAAGSNETYTILSARSVVPNFTGLIEDLVPSDADTTYSFFGERFLVVLGGEIELQIDTTTYRLGPGRMIHYSAHPNHRLRVVSEQVAQMLWVVTPALL